jgi:phosphoserine phosphatase
MSYVLTIAASHGNPDITNRHIDEVGKVLEFYNLDFTCEPVWLHKGRAVDLGVADRPQGALIAHLQDVLKRDKMDIFSNPVDGRRKKLLIADMDSTIVESETLDELADAAGIKEKIALITQAAMEGKLDFASALKERVSLLKGLPEKALQDTLDKTRLNPGARMLVMTMVRHGGRSVLVSGGFTFFTGAVARRTGFDHHHGNTLEIENGKLTGKVKDPILDKYSKVDFLKRYANDMGIKEKEVLAIGDGANDIPMLKMAGLGIGYHPKETVKEQIANHILYGDLSAALYAQGYNYSQFVRIEPEIDAASGLINKA